MEFICVISVGGSLASYKVLQESEKKFKAVLRNNAGNRDDIPAQIELQKGVDGWAAQPWHDEIVNSLAHAIEANNHL